MMALTWHWSLWEDDGRGGQLHEDDLATGRQWTRETPYVRRSSHKKPALRSSRF